MLVKNITGPFKLTRTCVWYCLEQLKKKLKKSVIFFKIRCCVCDVILDRGVQTLDPNLDRSFFAFLSNLIYDRSKKKETSLNDETKSQIHTSDQ